MAQPGGIETSPVVRPGAIPARDGSAAASESEQKRRLKRRGSPVCYARSSSTSPANRCRTMGCEIGLMRRRLPRFCPRVRRGSAAADTGKPTRYTGGILTALQGPMVRTWERATAGQSSFSQLKLSEIQAKAIVSKAEPKKLAEQWSTLAKSTKGCRGWQRRTSSETRGNWQLRIHRYS